MKRPKGFGQYLSKARAYMKDKQTIVGLIQAAIRYAKNNKTFIKDIKIDIQALINLLRDWVTGQYVDVTAGTILLVIGALIYFISPIDVIPDFLGPLGFTDDAAVICFVVRAIKKELTKYRQWKMKKSRVKKPTIIKETG